ncbi:MAG: FliM/FliN family flagellar motor switch protein [Gammaproteobacteria bacterium]|nr:FliM/FliN family flagellar motor switch protein [Gammaproteobacteria bacterium]
MIRPFKIYSKSEMENIKNKLFDIFQTWVDDWIYNNDQARRLNFEIEIDKKFNYEEQNSQCYVCQTELFSSYLITNDKVLNELLFYITNIDETVNSIAQSDVSLSIVIESLAELLNNLCYCERSNDAKLVLDKISSRKQPEKNSGEIFVSIKMINGTINLILPYEGIRNLFISDHSRTVFSKSLSSRNNCRIYDKLKLSLSVGCAELEYNNVANLAVGDVIRLESKIEDPLTIYTDDAYVCDAYLGKKNNKKAAKVILSK